MGCFIQHYKKWGVFMFRWKWGAVSYSGGAVGSVIETDSFISSTIGYFFQLKAKTDPVFKMVW
jgi:hypothetical protein